MTAMSNIPEKATKAQSIRLGPFKLRAAIAGVMSGWFGPSARFDDDANQAELGRLAHHRREEIRRAADELRRLGVRN